MSSCRVHAEPRGFGCTKGARARSRRPSPFYSTPPRSLFNVQRYPRYPLARACARDPVYHRRPSFKYQSPPSFAPHASHARPAPCTPAHAACERLPLATPPDAARSRVRTRTSPLPPLELAEPGPTATNSASCLVRPRSPQPGPYTTTRVPPLCRGHKRAARRRGRRRRRDLCDELERSRARD